MVDSETGIIVVDTPLPATDTRVPRTPKRVAADTVDDYRQRVRARKLWDACYEGASGLDDGTEARLDDGTEARLERGTEARLDEDTSRPPEKSPDESSDDSSSVRSSSSSSSSPAVDDKASVPKPEEKRAEVVKREERREEVVRRLRNVAAVNIINELRRRLHCLEQGSIFQLPWQDPSVEL